MSAIEILSSPPVEAVLYAAVQRMEAENAASIQVLRKRTQNTFLRNIISGLWYAILHRAVAHFEQNNPRKDIFINLAACLRAGKEILPQNNNINKTISKRLRSGSAAWYIISKDAVALVFICFSKPPSKHALLKLAWPVENIAAVKKWIRPAITRTLKFIRATLQQTDILYKYMTNGLEEIEDLIERQGNNKDLKTHSKQSQLTDTPGHVRSDSSHGLAIEASFTRCTYPRYTVQYDSPIFVHIQSGNIAGVQALFQEGLASIYIVDPYGLGLLYYAGYYCWRCIGATTAMRMCKMLTDIGVDMNIVDELGNTPIHTMIDSALMERDVSLRSASLVNVGLFCNLTSQELIQEHRSYSNFTTLHEALLGIHPKNPSLQGHLQFLQEVGSLPEIIDQADSRGRSALAWAVEYGRAEAVQTLLSFGANACQHRISFRSRLPLLHLAIAGPPPPPTSEFHKVVSLLLDTNIDINARDEEGWSAWHIAASWRSYDILRAIWCTHGPWVQLDAQTNDGASAHDLAQDETFYKQLVEVGNSNISIYS